MKQLSRSVVFVDTNPKNERIAVLKNNDSLSQLNGDDTNVLKASLRPQQLNSMCLAEFATIYAISQMTVCLMPYTSCRK